MSDWLRIKKGETAQRLTWRKRTGEGGVVAVSHDTDEENIRLVFASVGDHGRARNQQTVRLDPDEATRFAEAILEAVATKGSALLH